MLEYCLSKKSAALHQWPSSAGAFLTVSDARSPHCPNIQAVPSCDASLRLSSKVDPPGHDTLVNITGCLGEQRRCHQKSPVYIYIHDNAICNYICNNMPSFVIPVPQLQSQTLSSCNTLFIAPGLKFWLRCGTFQRGPLLVAGGGIVDKVLGQVGVGWIPKSSAIMCNNG